VTSTIVIVAFLLIAIRTTGNVLVAQTSCGGTSSCPLGIFCTGFEEGTDSIWDDYAWDTTANTRMIDPGPCNNPGNTVMRLRIPPGRGGTDMIKVLPGNGYDKLYARWYQKFETGFDFAPLSHIGGGFHAGSRDLLGRSDIRPNGADTFNTRLEVYSGSNATLNGRAALYTYYRGMNQQCADPTSNCWGDYFPVPGQVVTPQYTTNRWYCLEVMIDAGSPVSSQAQANGVQAFWIDGVQYGPWTNLWHRTTASLKMNIFLLQLFHHGSHSVAGIILDDVVVSTNRIGCHGGGTPSAPTNLRITPPAF
jgi:hypothetical protein